MDKNELIKEKEKIKKRYKWSAIAFSIFLIFINIILAALLVNKVGMVTLIILFCISIVIPVIILLLTLRWNNKEKHLRVLNFLNSSYLYIVNLLLLVVLFLYHDFKIQKTVDFNFIISFYAISWSIYGICITTFGIWFSVNFKNFKRNKDDNFYEDVYRYESYVGLIFIFLSLLVGLAFLLSATNYISNPKIGSEHPELFVGLIYINAHIVLNILIFLFFPLFVHIHNEIKTDCDLICSLNKVIETCEEIEKDGEQKDEPNKGNR